MQHGQVRAILWRHASLARSSAAGPHPVAGDAAAPQFLDAGALLPASRLRTVLDALDAAEQRRLGADYAALWARTFRVLVSHLRGRPERALALFAEEVYPFLRGDRRAARVEQAGPAGARLVLADDLPPEYLAGMAAGFVGLSGARVAAEPAGHGVLALSFRTPPQHAVFRLVASATALRLPLMACALLSVLTGAALSSAAGPVDARLLALTLAGVLGAQLGANALHSLRHVPPTAFAPGRTPRPVLIGEAALGYTVAAFAAIRLVAATSPALVVFVSAGLGLGLAYARFRERGLGPAIAGLTYGLLVPAGTVAVLQPGVLASPIAVPLVAAPLGLMAAALLLLDNLADKPLDEAGGQRTLAVRLPPQRAATVYAALLAAAVVWLAMLGLAPDVRFLLAAAILALPAALLAFGVRARLPDPHALAPLRLGTFALLVAVAAVPILFFAEAA